MRNGERYKRPTHDRNEKMPQILTLLREGRTLREVCDTVGVTRPTIWRWTQEDPDGFGAECREAQGAGLIQAHTGTRPTEAELAYTAGFMDGEGCFRIQRGAVQKNGWRYYMPTASCTNTDVGAINFLNARWPGTVSHGYQNPRHPNRKLVSDWRISGAAVIPFLNDIYPYLRIKRPQAELIFEFMAFLGERRRKEKKNRSVEEQAYVTDFFFRMRRLNQRGKELQSINLD